MLQGVHAIAFLAYAFTCRLTKACIQHMHVCLGLCLCVVLIAGESVETGAITLDLQKMSDVRVAPDHNTAWVQGGANMGT